MAGNGDIGACFVVGDLPVWPVGESADPEGKFSFAGCADGFTLAECSSIDELVEFAEGATCADLAAEGQFTWDGSCEADVTFFDEVCVQLWSASGTQASQALCAQELGGEWSNDTVCGGVPVPTLPPVGLAALMLLLLAGALLFLTKKASSPAV